MHKLNKRDYLNILILCLLYLFVVFLITHGTNMYGSSTDWARQHWSIPEYFRTLFYHTGNLLPDFAPNLGGGQNIFYFAYYGFLSPIILISYLLPNVQMYDYIMISTIITGLLSAGLFYKWLKNNNYSTKICFLASAIFVCASPLIFHSHRQIMFVNYMPFLILGLMGVDKHFYQKKSYLLVISTFLVIMTSYFYSVGAILCLVIYGIYVFLKINPKPKLKEFLMAAIKFAIPIIIAIMLSCLLLLPVLNALLNGRVHGDVPIDIFELITPHLGLEYLLYSSYSVGLTAIVIIALFVNIIQKSNSKRFLNIALIAIITSNFFIYLLNGTLYLNGKALIPLLPLYALAIAIFVKAMFNKKIEFYNILSMFALTLIFIILLADEKYATLYIIDGFVMLLLIYNFYKTKNQNKFIIPLIILVYLVCIFVNFSDELITKESHQKQTDPNIQYLVDKVVENDDSYYRIYTELSGKQSINRVLNPKENILTLYSSTYNKEYNEFFYHIFNNNLPSRNSVITHEDKNIMFETYMGVKYYITDKSAPLGYKQIDKKGSYKLYINESAMPVGYASNNLISESEYKQLKYPYKVEALMNNIVVKDAKTKELSSNIKKYNPEINDTQIKNLKINQKNGQAYIQTTSHQDGKLKLTLQEPLKDQLLLVRIHVSHPQSCDLGDTSISINGIKNKLTCREWKYYNHNQTFDYTISSPKEIKNLNITFTQGSYTINGIEMYTLDYSEIQNLKNNVDPFIVDTKTTKGDVINGEIDITKDGYFALTIPYDKGFNIKVDGQEIKYEKVNDAFIGFKIDKGHHQISITYEAPYFNIGKIISVIGLISFTILVIYQAIKTRKLPKAI